LNLAVALAAGGDANKAAAILAQVDTSLKQGSPADLAAASSISGALTYNRALLLAGSGDSERQRLAIGELEIYLRRTGSSLAWWPLAYQRYLSLCKQFGTEPKSQATLLSNATVRFRPVAALELTPAPVALGESLTDAQKTLGSAAPSIPLIRGTNLVEVDYQDRGIKLIGTDEVLAIVISGDHAPAIPVRAMGLGTKPVELKVGMTRADLDRVMADTDYDFRQLIDPSLNYRFYSDLGIAVLIQGEKIVELAIGQVPKRRVEI
jgi:hypothetical protein